MAHAWKWQGIELEHFSPKEFDRPELMDAGFLRDLDTLRTRCGFPIDINDDARNEEDLARIYRKEIAKGLPYPRESSHLYVAATDRQTGEGAIAVRAVDLEPTVPRPGDGCALTLEERELELQYQVLRMWKEGRWKHLGFGVETGHFHVDDTPRLGQKRPAFWVAVSR